MSLHHHHHHHHVLTATCIRRPRNLHTRLAYAHPHAHANDPASRLRPCQRKLDSPDRPDNAPPDDDRPDHHHHHHAPRHSEPPARPAAAAAAHSSPLSTVVPLTPNPLAAVARKARSSFRDISRSNSVKYLIAGAIAGIVSRTAVSPLEVVATVNMCTSGATPPLHLQLRRLLATEGLRGFFKGNAANCLKVAPTKGIQFVAFEALKRLIHRARQRKAGEAATASGAVGAANAATSAAASSTAATTTVPTASLAVTERFFAGGMAGIIAATLCYPLDTAKTLLTAHPERFRGVFSTISSITRNHGPVALYRGLSPTLVAMMPYAGLDFAIYEQLKIFYLRRNKKEANLLILLFIGAFAGAVAQTACHPLDVLRKRLQLQGINGRPVQYKSMLDAAVGIVRKEGVGSLYRGLQPMYISAIPSAGVSYVVYEAVKNLLGVRSFQ